MKDCRECANGQKTINKQRMCDAMRLPKPIEYMRHELSDCGPEGMLFEPLNTRRYTEFDE